MVSIIAFLASAAVPGGVPVGSTDPASHIVLRSGLAVWRKPGLIQNHSACATCHSPDGIEIASYAFSDADLLRRAEPHLGSEDSQRIVAYIHALRAKLGIVRPRDPIRDRPLQPGGAVLPGSTPAERDLAFGRELAAKLPLLFGPPLVKVELAARAERQVLALSPVTLKIGIPLSRLSEDSVHGADHASIAQWLPELPPSIPESRLREWYAAEDAYLAAPSATQLGNLLGLHRQLIKVDVQPGLAALSTTKFRSLLILQDRMRNGGESKPTNFAPELVGPGRGNVLWEVGDLARDLIGQNSSAIQMPAEIEAKKGGVTNLQAQLAQIRLTWFWLGWVSDQGLFLTSPDVKTKLGMWLSQSLSQDGPYPIHNVYANIRRQAVISNDVNAWGETSQRRRRIWDLAGLRSFRYYFTDLPKAPEHRAVYSTFTANCFRMSLLLLASSIESTHQVWVKQSSSAIVKEMCDFIEYLQPGTTPQTVALKRRLDSDIAAAQERR